MERVLPAAEVKSRIADLAVGLAADCDRPENDVEKIMRTNLPDAQKLPFVAFVTHDSKWVEGYAGFKRPGDFLAVLAKAEDTPYLKATPEVRKTLAGLVDRSEKAAQRGYWKTVLKLVQTANKTTGRCPERDQMAALEKSARAWAAAQFKSAIKLARTSDGIADARKVLSAVSKQFIGQPEAAVARTGTKALQRLAKIHKAEEAGSAPEDLREKAARDFKNTPWSAIFVAPDGNGQDDGDSEPEEDDEDDEETEIEIE